MVASNVGYGAFGVIFAKSFSFAFSFAISVAISVPFSDSSTGRPLCAITHSRDDKYAAGVETSERNEGL